MKTKKMTSYTTTEFFIVHGFATVSMEHSFKTMYVSPKTMVIFFFAKHSYTIFYLKTVYENTFQTRFYYKKPSIILNFILNTVTQDLN